MPDLVGTGWLALPLVLLLACARRKTALLLAPVVALFGIVPNLHATSLTDGLVAYYPFNGNANDESGMGNNGVEHNVGYAAGINAQGLSVAGNPNTFGSLPVSYVEVPSSPSISSLSQDVSFSLWFKLNEYPTHPGGLIYKAGQQPQWMDWTDRSFALWFYYDGISPTRLALSSTTSTDDVLVCGIGPTPILTDEFYHVAGVISTTDHLMRLYLNGAEVAESSFEGDGIVVGDFPLRIGAPFVTAGNQLGVNGVIDNVRIYNRALSGDEVELLYTNEGTQSVPDTMTTGWLTIPALMLLAFGRRKAPRGQYISGMGLGG